MGLPEGPSIKVEQLFEIFTTNPFPFLRECFETYGDLFTLQLGNFGVDAYGASGAWVFMSCPDHLRTLFTTDAAGIRAGAANDIQFQQLLPPESSVIMDGREHLDRRRLLSKLVQGEKTIRGSTHTIYQLVADEVNCFPQRDVFSLSPILRRISNEVMQHLTFGSLMDDNTAYISTRISQFGDLGLSREDKIALVDDCCSVLNKKIGQAKKCPHAAAGDQNDIFSLLLGAEGLSEADIRAELLVILLGGTDTTTSTMAWIMAWILADGAIYKRILEEIQSLGDRPLQSEDIDRLEYLDAVIVEACRISPVLFNSSARLLTQPMQLDGYTLPPGTIAASCSYLVHTREDNYPNPFRFDSERFRGVKPDPYRWVPFGGGIRRCLGMAFALYEMKVVIASVLRLAKLEPVEVSTKPELQGTFFAPAGGVRVKANVT